MSLPTASRRYIVMISVLLVLLFASSGESVLLSNHVFGTIATSCGQTLYHTPPNVPYPTWDSQRPPGWIAGPSAVCVRDTAEVLHYCRQLYAPDSPDSVQQAILSPFTLTNHSWPPYPPTAFSQSVQIYLCLGPSSSDSTSTSAMLQPPEFKEVATTTTSTAQSPRPRHLPSLVDVHRAYFADKFRRLANETATNVSQLVDQLRRGSEGLAKLYHSDPDLIRYSVSSLLQDAHRRLTKIWANEAGEWSRLEQARHADLVRQFDSEDWAGENEFTYVLQESQLDLDRVQDALTNLLNRLADSVHEEVRHLRLVQAHQPWTLASYQTNWTNHITHEFTNIERVHEVLLKHVQTATRAINTVRMLMIKQSEQSKSPRSLIRYKPPVLTSYNRLQSELFTAESAVSEAKATLLTNVTDRMHSLLTHMMQANRSSSQPSVDINLAASDEFVSEWLQSVHHSELAFIDLLVSRIVGLPASDPIPESSSMDHIADSLWRPAQSSETDPALDNTIPLPEDSLTEIDPYATDKPSRLALHWLLIIAFAALCCLFASLALLFVCCLAVRWGRRQRRDMGWVGAALDKGTHRLKHLAYRSRLFGSRADTPTWKVERHVVVLTGGQPSVLPGGPANVEAAVATPRGYANPIVPSC